MTRVRPHSRANYSKLDFCRVTELFTMTAELMKNSDITQAHDVYYGITNTYAYRTPCLCLRVRLRVFGLTLARRSRS